MASGSKITRRRFLVMTAGGVLGLLGCDKSGERKDKGQAGPNLLFVFSDQQRRHALGFMKEDPVITPNIDKFASEALVLDNALSCYPLCGPYRGTLMTGRYPLTTGVDFNGKGLKLSEIGFGSALKNAGYQTGYIGKWHLYDNGIDDWRDWHFIEKGQFVPKEHRFGFDYWHATNCNHRTFYKLYYEDGEESVVNEDGWQITHETDTAIDYIKNKRSKDRPFALFVSMVPPHNTHGPGFEPYILTPNETKRPPLYRTQYHAPKKYEALYRERKLKRRPNVPDDLGEIALPGYFGACTAIDEEFGRMMKCLEEEGIDENTIVVYTSDHGDMMGSHGRFQKGVWQEESIGIPFIIRWPGRIKPGRNDVIFNSVDVMPTLLSMAGAKVPEPVEGRDRSGILLGKGGQKPESAFIMCGNWRGIRTAGHTFVAQKKNANRPTDMFFHDNQKDPYQMKQIRKGDGQDELFEKLRVQLKDWLIKTNDPFADLL